VRECKDRMQRKAWAYLELSHVSFLSHVWQILRKAKGNDEESKSASSPS